MKVGVHCRTTGLIIFLAWWSLGCTDSIVVGRLAVRDAGLTQCTTPTVFAAGGTNNVGNVFLRWDGAQWNTEASAPASEPLTAIWGVAEDDLWAVGWGGVIVHWNGNNWTTFDGGNGETLRSLYGFAADDIWAVGGNGFVTHWDGIRWSAESAGISGPVSDIFGVASDDVWVVDRVGGISRFDGGAWTPADSGRTDNILSAWGGSSNSVWFVGNSILRWIGSEFDTVEDGILPPYHGVYGIAENDVWAVGEMAKTAHWDGQVWQEVVAPGNALLRRTWGVASDDVWTVGSGGAILHWDGSTWETSSSGTTEDLYALFGLCDAAE
jgi:hypothetical protein